MRPTKTKLSVLARATAMAAAPADAIDEEDTWSRLAGRLDDRRRARARRRAVGVPLGIAVVAGAAAVGWFVVRPGAPPSVEAGRVVESDGNAVAVALPDGIRVDLDRHSRVDVDEISAAEIRVALGRGRARFDVEPRQHRRFIVMVDGTEVRVVGTRFSVARLAAEGGDGPRMEVAVERGVVEVRNPRHDAEVRRLRAGERFSTPIAPREGEGAAAASPSSSPLPAIAPAAVPAQAPPAVGAPSVAAVPIESARASSSSSSSVPDAARPARATPPEGARQLFEHAQDRWRAGRMAEAAALYEQVLARHPADARAALAALELGRIRMDHLGDPAGAVVSLERAIALGPRASFREDALARLARANARLGRDAGCRRARDAYLSQYPAGIHVSTVATACEKNP